MTYPTPPAPRPLPADATTEGLAFHRLVFARRRSGWWTPLATGALGVAFYLVVSLVLGVALVAFIFVSDPMADPDVTLDRFLRFDVRDPLSLAVPLVSLALMIPCYLFASWIVNGGRIRLISSVAGRLRWRWMLLCAGAALAVYLVISALSFLLPAEDTAGAELVAPAENSAFLASFVVLLLFVPLQSAAEEYVFRGYFMQAIGRWLKHPLWAILLPVPVFVLGHGYDPLGQTGVGIFAIAAGWLVWRTGGLEAAIALHVVNNLVAFGFSLFGLSDVNATDTSALSLVGSVVMIGAYCAVVEWLWRKGDGRRTLRLTPAPAVAPPVFAYPPAGYPVAAGVYPGQMPPFSGGMPPQSPR
ncbi:CPBP family intramembrane glutamic endopeptidase, partial [Microbacterium sp.]|uniref:CPBP family intramembrane glutamic endopeptidase n=1 Tax=Microbacterium sp. TaxID=51671 RepID=UPI0037365141